MKYINKGCGAVVLRLRKKERNFNEADNFLTGRFINANEAAYRVECAIKMKF